MSRLTTNKNVSEMGMWELAHNSCYSQDGKARYRDFDTDIDAREFARNLMVAFGEWKRGGLDTDNELVDDDIFDDTMLDNLSSEPNEIVGLIALFYRNLWAMADLYEELKEYEDTEEKGLLLKVPCKVGDYIYDIDFGFPEQLIVTGFSLGDLNDFGEESEVIDEVIVYWRNSSGSITGNFVVTEIGQSVFLTKEEAEQKLRELN